MTTVEQTSDVAVASRLSDVAPSGSITTGFIGLIAVGGALLSSAVTFFVLEGFTPIVATPDVVATLLYVNGATVLVLLAIIGRDIWNLLQGPAPGQGWFAPSFPVRPPILLHGGDFRRS